MTKSILCVAVRHCLFSASLLALAGVAIGASHEITADQTGGPVIHPASAEGEQAIGHFKIPDGLKIELWAAEPMLANPVCMRVDNRDRVYLVETFRHTSNVLDIRGHMDWLVDDLACRSVEDRVALLKRKFGPNIRKFTQDDDRIRLIEDTTGAGKADKATVFAGGFNRIESGIAAGILPFRGSVYLADIPSLYLLRDAKGDGVADYRQEISTGYGVHISFLGHDLHGLCLGPDRKLYFSIGDRGTNAKALDGSAVDLPDTGGVFRCDPDGSKLEIFATGLRNPQQMCFDDYGDLMTGDNNPDYGDPARWVYVVEGGDSGWRIGYQEARLPRGGGPWMWEQLYQTADKLKDAAYILPPVAHLGSGPSGVAYYPGTGLPHAYDKHFFMVDFRGGSTHSVVHSFALKQNGATFDLVDHADFIKGMLATDIDFSARGGMYACDWTDGWAKPGKGRIYRIFDPVADQDPVVGETRKLLADGLEKRSSGELAKLLSHRDQRVRREAQFALTDRGAEAVPLYDAVASNAKSDQLARLHAIWGLGELGVKTPTVYLNLLPLLGDGDPEVRAQAAKTLGEGRVASAYDGLTKMLSDAEARPKFFAAIALGRLGRREAIPALLGLLRSNDDKDAHLRHAAVMGLIGSGDVDAILAAAKDPSASVRLGVVVALRRLQRPEIAQFLDDPDPHLVSEAAHAINDVPIAAALPRLAALLERSNLPQPVLLRAVNAAYRVGGSSMAHALAVYAAKQGPADADWIRVEALNDLGAWADPSPLDRVMNMYRPLPKRDETVARDAAGLAVSRILHPSAPGAPASNAVRVAAVSLIKKLKINDTAVLFELISAKTYPAELRAEALNALTDRDDPKLPEAVKIALADSAPKFREQAIRSLARLPDTTAELVHFLDTGSIGERQAALAALAEVKDPAAEQALAQAMDKLAVGEWKPELQLDLIEAARKRNAPGLVSSLQKYEASLSKADPLAEYRVALAGGNAENGRAIFDRSDASCVRCHMIRRQGGIVGPALDGVGARQTREYLLESIVFPNAKIAPGFETAVLRLKDGKAVTGVVKKDAPNEILLIDSNGQTIAVDPGQVQSRTRGVSAMPEGFGKTLPMRDLRDLVEYVASLKTTPGKSR
ncbi:MAG TPA: PVC-type heme-binding CxxCH protein [Tepidisphaeraceae bacterium]|jgi:quinoprotein glucose dehydrogenase|nr:PVC-type heme-binding CxxCH protein [Tepidisphaeraceae bacterium]